MAWRRTYSARRERIMRKRYSNASFHRIASARKRTSSVCSNRPCQHWWYGYGRTRGRNCCSHGHSHEHGNRSRDPSHNQRCGSLLDLQLIPGPYDIRVEREGFGPKEKDGLTLVAEQNASADFMLQPGKVSEKVTVEAGAELIHTERLN